MSNLFKRVADSLVGCRCTMKLWVAARYVRSRYFTGWVIGTQFTHPLYSEDRPKEVKVTQYSVDVECTVLSVKSYYNDDDSDNIVDKLAVTFLVKHHKKRGYLESEMEVLLSPCELETIKLIEGDKS